MERLPEMSKEAADAVLAEWKRDPALRAEFGDNLQTFIHWKRAAASGRARILGGRVAGGDAPGERVATFAHRPLSAAEKTKAAWLFPRTSAALRAEFRTEASYTAYLDGVSRGKVRAPAADILADLAIVRRERL